MILLINGGFTMTLREHAANVAALKKKLAVLRDEETSTCDHARYKELPGLINVVINEIYDAVGDFEDAIKAEIGVAPRELSELLTAHGYVGGRNVKLPRRVQAHFGE